MRTGSPATASMTTRTTAMMMAVPRSGWIITSSIGTAAIASMRNRSRQVSPSIRRATKVARATIRPRMANSEGWTSIGPTLIQRPAPWALVADHEDGRAGRAIDSP